MRRDVHYVNAQVSEGPCRGVQGLRPLAQVHGCGIPQRAWVLAEEMHPFRVGEVESDEDKAPRARLAGDVDGLEAGIPPVADEAEALEAQRPMALGNGLRLDPVQAPLGRGAVILGDLQAGEVGNTLVQVPPDAISGVQEVGEGRERPGVVDGYDFAAVGRLRGLDGGVVLPLGAGAARDDDNGLISPSGPPVWGPFVGSAFLPFCGAALALLPTTSSTRPLWIRSRASLSFISISSPALCGVPRG